MTALRRTLIAATGLCLTASLLPRPARSPVRHRRVAASEP